MEKTRCEIVEFDFHCNNLIIWNSESRIIFESWITMWIANDTWWFTQYTTSPIYLYDLYRKTIKSYRIINRMISSLFSILNDAQLWYVCTLISLWIQNPKSGTRIPLIILSSLFIKWCATMVRMHITSDRPTPIHELS
jgi:hypothetical protein